MTCNVYADPSGAWYGGLGGYAKAEKPDIALDGWQEWYRAAAEGLW